MDHVENDCSWQDFLRDCNFIDEPTPSNLLWANSSESVGGFTSLDIDFSSTTPPVALEEAESTRKRGRVDSCANRAESKACRERQRREKLNERFMDLCSVLEPGRPARTDKPAILDDAIRVLNQLKNESQELKDTNERLMEEIKSLKVEKNELREEKLVLKADKERMEQQLKSAANKMPVFPGYGMMPGMLPMFHYFSPSLNDSSRDHEYRPPAA